MCGCAQLHKSEVMLLKSGIRKANIIYGLVFGSAGK